VVLYEIYREDGGKGITFVHMLYIPYAGAALMLLHMNGKFIM
jgi:hypothetical protein